MVKRKSRRVAPAGTDPERTTPGPRKSEIANGQAGISHTGETPEIIGPSSTG